ncbi:protein phosphatase [Leucobacter komagatae]|uniref:Protein phosphatase n=1 Tax=Leucobacter komagatae TaxID=55969 RepID=A0A542Y7Z6_9MICO|nr:PP2C family serine/threonine-protein phosphatase [Leucobacter komagatae]TQL44220.1 protein phosphatase [Leucobacter komagatae]
MAYGYASAVASHVGMVRANNQDSGYAGDNLFLVADGMGGHAGGDVASALVTRDVAKLDEPPTGTPEESAERLRKSLLVANTMLRDTVKDHHELAGLGTTFVGFITVGNQLALAHIGDSRLYLFRDGVLQQITKDHTFVQRLVDSGRITEEEAQYHPRRSVLMRVLGDVESAPEVDTMVLDTRPDDIWLLCSDGLCGYVSDDDIEKILRRRRSLQGGVDDLIDKSLSHGAPDNVTVVLVETTTAEEAEELEVTAPDSAQRPGDTLEIGGRLFEDEDPLPAPTDGSGEHPGPRNPRFVGSAANAPLLRDGTTNTARTRLASRRRMRRLPAVEESHFEARADEYLAELLAETRRSNRRRRAMWLLAVVAVLAAIGGALLVGYQWTQTRYFVGTDGSNVIIYQGVHQDLGSLSLYSVAEDTGIPLKALDGLERRTIERTLAAGSLQDARSIVDRLGDLPDA